MTKLNVDGFEIEVTHSMVEAGLSAYPDHTKTRDERAQVVRNIFIAMMNAKEITDRYVEDAMVVVRGYNQKFGEPAEDVIRDILRVFKIGIL